MFWCKSIIPLCLGILFALCFSRGLAAQDFDIIHSESKRLNSIRFSKHLHSTESNHYVLFQNSSTTVFAPKVNIIKVLDSNFEEIDEFDLIPTGKDWKTRGVYFVKDKFIWIQQEIVRGEKQMNYYMTVVNLDGQEGRTIKILNCKKGKRYQDFRIVMNDDHTRIVFYLFKWENKSFFIDLVEYNDDLKEVWTKTEKISVDHRYSFIDLHLGKDESVILNIKKYDEKLKWKHLISTKDLLDYKPVLWKISKDTVYKEIPLALNDSRFVDRLRIIGDQADGKLLVLSLVRPEKLMPYVAVLHTKYNLRTEKFENTNIRDFTQEELDMLGKRNQRRAWEKNLRGFIDGFRIGNVMSDENGNVVYTVEYCTQARNSESSSNLDKDNRLFMEGSALMVHIDKDCEVTSVGALLKRTTVTGTNSDKRTFVQSATYPMYVYPFYNDGTWYYCYNENKRNFRKDIRDVNKYWQMIAGRQAISVISHFDENGLLVKKRFYNEKYAKRHYFAPKFCKEIGDNKYFFITYKRSQFRFRYGILSFKN